LLDSTSSNTYQVPYQGEELNEEYLVRASKLEVTPSGSFYNLSAGASALIVIITNVVDIEPLEVKLFPNPATDQVIIKTELPMLRVQVFQTSGRLVREAKPTAQGRETEVPLIGARPGIYLLRVEFSEGVVYRKLVVTE
jgi:hypothetical protein